MDELRKALKRLEEWLEDVAGAVAGNGGLKITVTQAATSLTNCGSAEMKVQWSLTDMAQTGWVIQHIKWEVDVKHCDGTDKVPNNPDGLEFWEAWEVSGGKVWVGPAANGFEHNADTYRTADEGNDTRGTVNITGKVRFVEGFDLTEPPWGHTVPEAGALPTRKTEPVGWSDIGTDDHDMVVTWNCCGVKNHQTVTTKLRNKCARLCEALAGLLANVPTSRVSNIGQPYVPAPEKPRDPMVEDAIRLLESCPPWSELARDDDASRRTILDTMAKLATYDLDVLRDAVQGYVNATRERGGYNVAEMSRLYVLNRYIFDVPDSVAIGGLRFGSFVGLPYDSESVNELWPLALDSQGQLALTGAFRGYLGESYLAVGELDHMRKTFGRRELKRETAD